MARVNINILGISELKWTGMDEFNSDDHYMYYCGQESLRRNGVAIMINKRVRNAVQFSSVAQSCPILQPHGLQHTRPPCLSPTPGACSNLSIQSVMPSNHLIFCHPLLLLPLIFPSIRVFSNESVLHIRWPKY